MPRRHVFVTVFCCLMAVVAVGVVAYFATLAMLGFKVKEFARRTA